MDVMTHITIFIILAVSLGVAVVILGNLDFHDCDNLPGNIPAGYISFTTEHVTRPKPTNVTVTPIGQNTIRISDIDPNALFFSINDGNGVQTFVGFGSADADYTFSTINNNYYFRVAITMPSFHETNEYVFTSGSDAYIDPESWYSVCKNQEQQAHQSFSLLIIVLLIVAAAIILIAIRDI